MRFNLLIILSFFIFPVEQGFSQSSRIDSLRTSLKIHEGTINFETEQVRGNILFELGKEYKNKHHLDSSKYYLDKAKIVFTNMGDTVLVATVTRYIGLVYLLQNDYDNAIDTFNKALSLFEYIGNKEGIANVYNNIGIMYDYRDYHDTAKGYYFKALNIFKSLGLSEGSGRVYNNLAGIYSDDSNRKVALMYYDSCLYEAIRTKDLDFQQTVYNNISLTLLDEKDYEKAYSYLIKSLNISIDLNSDYNIANTYKNMARYYLDIKDYNKCIDYASKSLKIGRAINSEFIIVNDLERLTSAYEYLANYDSAFYYLKLTQAWNDSTFTHKELALLNNMEKKYEIEKKEKELALKNAQLVEKDAKIDRDDLIVNFLIIGLVLVLILTIIIYRSQRNKAKAASVLKIKNQEIEAKKQLIEASLKEKDALLKEIHHRVKNNLQVISSLLNMQTYQFDNPQMIAAMTEGQSRVKAMALIHQKLYQTDQLSEIDFHEYAEQLIGHLTTVFDMNESKVVNSIHSSEIRLDVDTAIPLGLILNELITNAYKYAFQNIEKGELNIFLKRVDKNTLKLAVYDNGNGLPENFDLNKVNSLGLKLVKILTDQLDGLLSIKNEHGASFEIIFKENKAA
jgi:two-component system, sensor histidine kinase PdtaS